MSTGAVVTVRGIRRAAHAEFIEFEYSLSNGELAVELVMPIAALREFTAGRDANLRFADPAAERAYRELDRRTPAPQA